MPLSQGQVLNDRYRIARLLGQGGFGAVYRAWDVNLSMPVALKENLNVTPEAVRQFEREARFLAGLRHDGLPFVIDHFVIPNQGQYMVMQFIEGSDLQEMLDQQPGGLPEAQVLPWFEQVCEALNYLHRQSPPVIHRDIKPANLKITPQGQAVLVDFGIAKQYRPGHQTTIGARAVTQGFSPPEQYGGGSTDIRSDIYSLGATLYAALTGQIPPDSLQRQLGGGFLPPRQFNPVISPHLEQAILRAMELNPDDRFQRVSDFQQALHYPAPGNAQVAAVHAPAQPVAAPTYRAPVPGTAVAPPDRFSQPAYGTYSPPEEPFAPVEDYPAMAYSPAPPRPSGLLWPGLVAFLAVCLVGGLVAGAGLYALGYLPDLGLLVGPAATPAPLGVVAPTIPPPTLEPPPTQLVATLPATSPPTPPPVSLPSATFTLPPTLTPWPSATPTPTPNLQATWVPCPGTYPSRLYVGNQAMVSSDPPLPNRVRSEPNTTTNNIIGMLQVGEKMEILEGPVCSQGWIWWRVRSLSTGLTGWTAEGDASGYWLVPLN